MPTASVTKFNARHPHRPRRTIPIIEEVRHVLTQLELQKQYPNREPNPEYLDQSEWSPWPSVFDYQEGD
jgi:hypothetical protein